MPRRSTIAALILLILASVTASPGCHSASPENGQALEVDLPREARVKQQLIGASPAPPAQALIVGSRFEKTVEGPLFVRPTSVQYAASGDCFVTDANGHSVYRCRRDSLEPSLFAQQLRSPTAVQTHNNEVYVNDVKGIHVYDLDGELKRSIATYYGINHFAIGGDGNIYINPVFSYPRLSDPLILRLDSQGIKQTSIGARHNTRDWHGVDDRVYLCTAGELIAVAFRSLPLLRIYDHSSGELKGEFQLTHPIFGGLQALAQDRSFTNPRPGVTALPRYVAGIRTLDNYFFVLLHLPYPEILQMDLQGREVNRWRNTKLPFALDYFGFDVRYEQGALRFIVGLIHSNSSSTLAEFSSSHADDDNFQVGG